MVWARATSSALPLRYQQILAAFQVFLVLEDVLFGNAPPNQSAQQSAARCSCCHAFHYASEQYCGKGSCHEQGPEAGDPDERRTGQQSKNPADPPTRIGSGLGNIARAHVAVHFFLALHILGDDRDLFDWETAQSSMRTASSASDMLL